MTTQPFECKFNQDELMELTGAAGNNNIVVSFCSMPSENELHFCATALKEDGSINTSAAVIIGCPYPPGWEPDLNANAEVTHTSVGTGPKFFLKANILGAILPSNSHSPNKINQVSAILDSELNANGELEFFVSFVMKDASGRPVGNMLRADSELQTTDVHVPA